MYTSTLAITLAFLSLYLNNLLILSLVIFLLLLLLIQSEINQKAILTQLDNFTNNLDSRLLLKTKSNPKFQRKLIDLTLKVNNYIDTLVSKDNKKLEKNSNKTLLNLIHSLSAKIVLVCEYDQKSLKIKNFISGCNLTTPNLTELEFFLNSLIKTDNEFYYSFENTILSPFNIYSISQMYGFPIVWNEENRKNGFIVIAFSNSTLLSLEQVFHCKKTLHQYCKNLNENYIFNKLKKKILTTRTTNIQKNKLIIGLSHDLRSPLNNIKAILSCLKEKFHGEEELFKLANSNITLLNDFIENLLDLTKYRAGKLKNQKEIISLKEILNSIYKSFYFDAKLKKLDFFLTVPNNPKKVSVDPTQIKRIINNLISNAIKYTNSGKIEIIYDENIKENFVSIVIKDTGQGLLPLQIEKIYEPFTRFKDRDIQGVGLGLAITKLLTELNNGKIEVNSTKDIGSEFIVHLPS